MATRKVISKKTVDKVELDKAKAEEPSKQETEEGYSKEARPKRGCLFCEGKLHPSYTDLANLRRFLTDRAKILPRARSGVCARHQRAVAKNIKYARHLALLPFVPHV